MAATYDAHHLRATSERRMVDFDPNSAGLTLVDLDPRSNAECLEIAEFRRFLAGLFRSVGTGTVVEFQVIAATDADGTGATIVKEHALAVAPDLVGDTLWLEVDAAQIREVLPAATHVGVRVQLQTSTDECVVFFERAEPFYPRAELTADDISQS